MIWKCRAQRLRGVASEVGGAKKKCISETKKCVWKRNGAFGGGGGAGVVLFIQLKKLHREKKEGVGAYRFKRALKTH